MVYLDHVLMNSNNLYIYFQRLRQQDQEFERCNNLRQTLSNTTNTVNSIVLSRESSTHYISEERPYNATRTLHNEIHPVDEIVMTEMNINSAFTSVITTGVEDVV